MEAIKIFKGNDTDFNNGQFLFFNISAVIDISSFSGIFKLGSFTATGNLKDGSMEIIIPNQVSSQFPLGNMCGSFTLVDTKNRIATVSNTIPFEITNIPFTPQAATIDLDVPEGYPVNISMQLGVNYVKQSDYAIDKAAMQAEINGKQAQLTAEQLLAVNSGITSSGVSQIGTNKDNITSLQANKQDNLTTAQLNAVDSGIDSTKVAQIATNKNSISSLQTTVDSNTATIESIAEQIDAEGYGWAKPVDWIDIRSGALPNSIYLLVGHSADYSLYNYLAFTVNVSNSGTYDVFIDGVKYNTFSSGSNAEIQWSALSPSSGYDVVYPSALKTHIVRITPSSSSDTLTKYTLAKHSSITANTYYYGVLWCHFSLENAIDLRYQLLSSYSDNGVRNLLAEAITANNDMITTANELAGICANCDSLKTVPTFYYTQSNFCTTTRTFEGCSQLKYIYLKGNFNLIGGVFKNCSALKEIKIDGKLSLLDSYHLFNGCSSLKKLPVLENSSLSLGFGLLKNNISIQNTFLDFSGSNSVSRLEVSGGNSTTNFVAGIKGIIVSSAAPFGGTSPQINVAYTGLNRSALVNLFNSLPTVSNSKVCNITGCTGAADLTAADLAIATAKGWTITR